MSKIYLGIDPGKEGVITEINEEISFFNLPKIGKEVDILELNNILSKYSDKDCMCLIEDVHAVFGSSAKGTFEFGKIVGVLEALLISNKIPFSKIQPKKWQKEMWEGIPLLKIPSSTGKTMKTDTKNMSLMAAKRLFPELDLRKSERAKKPDHNRVDSLLIAEYARRKF